MDVDKTIKVNNLAKELLKHGLVSSIDEGVEKATKHVEREIADSAELKPAVASSNQSTVSPGGGTDPQIFERKLNYLAKSFAEQFNAEIGEVKKQMEMMSNDIKLLRQTIKDLSMRQAQPASTASHSSEPQQQLRQPQEQQPKKKREEEPIKPRTGDLTPDDIDLEDYFYFGNKR